MKGKENMVLVNKVGAQIYALSNAVNSTGISIEQGIKQADDLLNEILKKNVQDADVETVLEVAAAWWAVQSTGSSSKTALDSVTVAMLAVNTAKSGVR